MKKLTLRWILCIFGIFCCFCAVIYAVIDNNPDFASEASTLAIAMTFAMLFLGRNSALKRLIQPRERLPFDVAHILKRLEEISYRKKENNYPPVEEIPKIVDDLVTLEAERQRLTAEGEIAEAKRLDTISQKFKNSLSQDRGYLILSLYLAEVARNEAFNVRGAIREHFRLLRSEAWPLAVLSVVATVLSGFGDNLVLIIIESGCCN